MYTIHIGVDPGKKGGYAIIMPDHYEQNLYVKAWDNTQFVKDMRDVATLVERTALLNEGCLRAVAAVEKVGAMPGQGVTGMFNFGQSYGFILGVLSAFSIGCQLVPPGVWKREYGLLKAEKRQSVEVCKRLFPDVGLLPGPRCKKESDGMAEALLIGEYGRRHF